MSLFESIISQYFLGNSTILIKSINSKSKCAWNHVFFHKLVDSFNTLKKIKLRANVCVVYGSMKLAADFWLSILLCRFTLEKKVPPKFFRDQLTIHIYVLQPFNSGKNLATRNLILFLIPIARHIEDIRFRYTRKMCDRVDISPSLPPL